MQRTFKDITDQDAGRTSPAARVLPFVLVGFGAAAIGGLLLEAGETAGLTSARMLRDPAAVYDFPAFAGLISTLGVWVMLAAAIATAFAVSVGTGHRAVFLFAGLSSLLIALDDQFLLHERVMPNATGLPELVFLLPYAVIGGAAPFVAARVAGWRGMAGLWPSLVFLGLSVVSDLEVFGESSYATEDLLKLAGFTAWAVFWIVLARSAVRQAKQSTGAG